MQRRLVVLVLAAAVLLTGCSPATSEAVRSASPSADPGVSATAETTPTPEPELLVVGIDGISHEAGAQATPYPFDDGPGLVAFFDDLTGTSATGTEIEGPYGGEWGTRYEWPGASVIVYSEGAASMSITAAEVAGIPIAIDGGTAVGSSRADVEAAGGWDVWDSDADGVADHLGWGGEEIPGTQSLSRPGEVGIEFVLLVMDDDRVAEIQTPANDYSDI